MCLGPPRRIVDPASPDRCDRWVWRRSRVRWRADRRCGGGEDGRRRRQALERAVTALAVADLAAPIALALVDEADTGRLVARGADRLHVGDVDGGFGLDDPATLTAAALLLDALVLLDVVHALD